MSSIIYQTLSDNQIRLLKPIPGHATADLRFSFEIITLQRDGSTRPVPPYTAVSYTWGNLPASEQIYIDDCPVLIRPNLAFCVRKLLDENEAERAWTHIWADAICINQQDKHERNAQVRLMEKTYALASIVTVWLGQSHNEGQMDGAKPSTYHYDPSTLTRPWHLSDAHYWQRLWIIQEFLLAQRIAIYDPDGDMVHIDAFRDRSGGDTVISKEAHEDNEKMTAISSSGFLKQERTRFANPMGGRFGVSTFGALLARRYGKAPGLGSLANLLRAYAGSQCADPRDKVFGVMSLLDQDEKESLQRLLPNYFWSEGQIAAVALVHIVSFNGLLLGHKFVSLATGKPRRRFLLWYLDEFTEIYRNRKLSRSELMEKLPHLLRYKLTSRLLLTMHDLIAWLADC